MSAPDNWLDLCRRLGARRGVQAVYAELAGRYAAPPRAYHNLDHIGLCLAEFEPLRPFAESAVGVELALWFHDAVCDPRRDDNEVRSAELAVSSVARLGLGAMLGELVYELVLDTRHAGEPATSDGRIVADVDLAILGQPAYDFDAYERAIREEYSHVPEAEFRSGRIKVLRGFLARPAIYRTPAMAAKYEAAARANLERSVERLLDSGG